MATFNQVEAKIKEEIKKNCVVMYSRPGCPFCTMAEKIFRDMKCDFREIDICKDSKNTDTTKNVLGFMTGKKTVPRVFVGGKFIGGGTETKKLFESGELQKMVDACSAESS